MIYLEKSWHWVMACDGSMDIDSYGWVSFYSVRLELTERSEITLPQIIQIEIDG